MEEKVDIVALEELLIDFSDASHRKYKKTWSGALHRAIIYINYS